jgi:hypothetical protein
MRCALAALSIVTALAACAVGPASPERVTLDADLLSVRMSDGSTCRGPAPASGFEAGWSGTLTGCAATYPYVVEIDPGTNPIRFVLQEILGDRIIRPVATVTITDATGRDRVFQTPERIEN